MKLDREQLESVLEDYLSSHPEVLFAYLFGSSIDSTIYRDVDLGIYVRNLSEIGDSLGYSLKMSVELERLLGSPVDVLVMNTAPDHLIHSVSKGKVLVNRDENTRIDFITAAWSRYFDVQHLRRQAIADMLS